MEGIRQESHFITLNTTDKNLILKCNYLNRMVSARLVGLVNFAKTMPAMQAWITTPTMLWTDMMTTASPQFSVGTRDPYPIVCWVSKLRQTYVVYHRE